MYTVLRALSEPRRIQILRIVRDGELTAGEIADRFDVTRPAISQHLRVLTQAGLIGERRQGTRRLYQLRPDKFDELRRFLDEFWDFNLERLKAAAEQAEFDRTEDDRL